MVQSKHEHADYRIISLLVGERSHPSVARRPPRTQCHGSANTRTSPIYAFRLSQLVESRIVFQVGASFGSKRLSHSFGSKVLGTNAVIQEP